MQIIDVIHQLLPTGLAAEGKFLASPSRLECPGWPPDVFAIVGTIIERSGCYTQASPDRSNLEQHEQYLEEVTLIAGSWTNLWEVPDTVQRLWEQLVRDYADVSLEEINDRPDVLTVLFKLCAVADEVSQGVGWAADTDLAFSDFQMVVFLNSIGDKDLFPLPHWPVSLCRTVTPDQLVVLPKSITTDKGCTVRSLSHNLALLPCRTILHPEWRFVSHVSEDELRLLLVPFPYTIPMNSFDLASERTRLKNGTTHAAFFKLRQNWLLKADGTDLTAQELADDLILPLIAAARAESDGKAPHGVILPECALNEGMTVDLVNVLRGSGIEFLITGVLDDEEQPGKRPLNKAYTVFMLNKEVAAPQNKHHRWRIDQPQADSYGLSFDSSRNQQWWEDIDVSKRGLPFYAVRKDTSMVTLICEDLARMEPAMNAIRAVGPNLVVALLMDGPQLGSRWAGRYAGVLADEPGCSVLTFTCAATVDLSNAYYKSQEVGKGNPEPTTKCVIGRWTQARDNLSKDVFLKPGSNGVLLKLESRARHQTTLDNRSDRSQSREIVLLSQHPLAAGQRPLCGA